MEYCHHPLLSFQGSVLNLLWQICCSCCNPCCYEVRSRRTLMKRKKDERQRWNQTSMTTVAATNRGRSQRGQCLTGVGRHHEQSTHAPRAFVKITYLVIIFLKLKSHMEKRCLPKKHKVLVRNRRLLNCVISKYCGGPYRHQTKFYV